VPVGTKREAEAIVNRPSPLTVVMTNPVEVGIVVSRRDVLVVQEMSGGGVFWSIDRWCPNGLLAGSRCLSGAAEADFVGESSDDRLVS